ncbi:MAG TPA: S8 family serine peptidase [Thermoanaerobaculia bacterium]
MRRLLAAAVLVILPSFAFAISESGPRAIERAAPRGRAVILNPVKDLTDYDRAQLAKEGLVVMKALPSGRYLARMAANADLTNDARVREIEPITAGQKLHRTAIRAAASGKPFMDVHVLFHSDVDFAQARAAILAAGGAMDIFTFDFLPAQRVMARIPSSSLLALAGDESVLAIVGPRKVRIASDNAVTAQLSKVDIVQAAPYNLTGEGVTVSLFELAAAQASHPEFEGRLTLAPTTNGGTLDDARHATHVAGTIGAAGIKAAAKGMAPKARIEQFCVAYDSNDCAGEWLELKEDELPPRGVTIDNNSWGYVWGWWDGDLPVWSETDIYWGAYDLILASPIDKIAREKDILFIHSAGNDATLPSSLIGDPWRSHHHVDNDFEEIKGQVHCVSQNGSGTDCPTGCNATTDRCEIGLHHSITPFDTLGTTAAAKNVVAVGALQGSNAIVPFSSRGPAKDGRVKPDVVARGASVHSTIPTNSYGNLSGTSMAAPAVAGIAALITEQWKRSYGTQPSAAAVKALLIAGTDEIGNPGPDYTHGFGLVNALRSVDLIRADEGAQQRIRTLSFAAGQQQSYELSLVVTETQNVRVVLNWTDPYIVYDPRFSDIAEKALVNNLDLRVIDPSGATVFPWILDKENYQAHATKGVNNVDNVEVVEIANAAPGVYRVLVSGTSVVEGPQSAVLVTNARTARPCRDVQEVSGNDSADRAYGNIPAGQLVAAGLCSQGDVDFYKFNVTKTGPIAVTVTAGDTALRATLTGNGISRTQEIAANTTAVLTADVNSVPNQVTLKIEAAGTLGAEPQYTLTATFEETRQPKRRTVRR